MNFPTFALSLALASSATVVAIIVALLRRRAGRAESPPVEEHERAVLQGLELSHVERRRERHVQTSGSERIGEHRWRTITDYGVCDVSTVGGVRVPHSSRHVLTSYNVTASSKPFKLTAPSNANSNVFPSHNSMTTLLTNA